MKSLNFNINRLSDFSNIFYVDGGCSDNGGENSRPYFSVKFNSQFIFERELLPPGFSTNNQAEFYAIRQTLKFCQIRKIFNFLILSDSKLAVYAVNGDWNVSSDNLTQLNGECQELFKAARLSGKIQLSWISRKIIEEQLGH